MLKYQRLRERMRYVYAYTHLNTVILVESYPFGNCMHPDLGIPSCAAYPVDMTMFCKEETFNINRACLSQEMRKSDGFEPGCLKLTCPFLSCPRIPLLTLHSSASGEGGS